jgi:hypothetical protein
MSEARSEHLETPADSVADMVGQRALELLAFEGDERRARYELVKDQLFWSAVGEGMPTADAYDMSEKVGQWALDLVLRITATGGARGGHA